LKFLLERGGRESPEAAMEFLRELELRTGIKLKDKKKPRAKRRNNA
jgi:hypothetical protein